MLIYAGKRLRAEYDKKCIVLNMDVYPIVYHNSLETLHLPNMGQASTPNMDVTGIWRLYIRGQVLEPYDNFLCF